MENCNPDEAIEKYMKIKEVPHGLPDWVTPKQKFSADCMTGDAGFVPSMAGTHGTNRRGKKKNSAEGKTKEIPATAVSQEQADKVG